ncbi:MAG: hypothetical protein KF866_01830 [Phycisphaeraceae bacterium]|nr:hypothetical protein [Phycisphaeraceae bacterium]
MKVRHLIAAAGIVALALSTGCGKKDKDGAGNTSGSKSSTKTSANDPVVGKWTLDGEKFKRTMFDEAVKAGEIPQGTTFDNPNVQQRLGAMAMAMTIEVKGDGTWSSTRSMGGGEAEISKGTWKKSGAEYVFTRTEGGDADEPDDVKVTVSGNAMTYHIPTDDGTVAIPLRRG